MNAALNFAKQIAYSSEATLLFTYDCAQKMRDVDGEYVECGVAAGAQIIAMAAGAPNKIIHAFDSFEGIPMPSNKDDQMPGIRMLSEDERVKLPNPGAQELVSSGATVVSDVSFNRNISVLGDGAARIQIHKGWFENTMPVAQIGKIAILRLDGDLYNSTMVCLKYLFPKVVTGGIVIIDDWQLEGCRVACEEYFSSVGYAPAYLSVSNIKYFHK